MVEVVRVAVLGVAGVGVASARARQKARGKPLDGVEKANMCRNRSGRIKKRRRTPEKERWVGVVYA